MERQNKYKMYMNSMCACDVFTLQLSQLLTNTVICNVDCFCLFKICLTVEPNTCLPTYFKHIIIDNCPGKPLVLFICPKTFRWVINFGEMPSFSIRKSIGIHYIRVLQLGDKSNFLQIYVVGSMTLVEIFYKLLIHGIILRFGL